MRRCSAPPPSRSSCSWRARRRPRAAPPGGYRLTSTQGAGNEVTFRVGADGRTVEDTNSFVYDESGNPYCVWGGQPARDTPSGDETPSPLGDDGSFTWHAHDDFFDNDADTTGHVAADGTAEADVTISNCEDLTPFEPPKPPAVTVHFTGGLVGSGGGSPPPSGSLPLLDPQPPVAPGGSPAPGQGYPAPPEPQSGCVTEAKAGELAGVASCWRLRGDVYSTGDRARVNGIDLSPASPGAMVRLDRRTQSISSTGPVEVRVGPLLLLRARIAWRSHKQVFSAKSQKFLGLPVKGGVQLTLEGGRTKLTMSVGRPRRPADPPADPARAPVGRPERRRHQRRGDRARQGEGHVPGHPGRLRGDQRRRARGDPADGRRLPLRRPGDRVRVPAGDVGIGGVFGIGAGDGYLKAGAFVDGLNKPLWAAIFLQKVGLTLQFNPFGWTGADGGHAGPQFRFRGNPISTLRLDGSLAYLSGNGGEPSALELAGALKADGRGGRGRRQGEGVAAAGSTSRGTRSSRSPTTASTGRWPAGSRETGSALDLEGSVNVSVPGPDNGGEGVISTRGLAACRRGFGPDVGFGYHFGEGIGGIRFMASSCDIGPWRELAGGASAARVGASTRVRRGQRQLTLVARGAAGAPGVAFVAPDGTRYGVTGAEGRRDRPGVPRPGRRHERHLLRDQGSGAGHLADRAAARRRRAHRLPARAAAAPGRDPGARARARSSSHAVSGCGGARARA